MASLIRRHRRLALEAASPSRTLSKNRLKFTKGSTLTTESGPIVLCQDVEAQDPCISPDPRATFTL